MRFMLGGLESKESMDVTNEKPISTAAEEVVSSFPLETTNTNIDAKLIDFDSLREDVENILTSKGPLEERLLEKYKSCKYPDPEVKMAFDEIFRGYLQKLIAKESSVAVLEEFLKLSINACRIEVLTPSTSVMLLTDIFDMMTLDDCKKMFNFVEDHVATWKEQIFFPVCKNSLLRLCNDLLRRLSKSNSTIFCGRILLFLAKFFPFSERSGLNIVGEFNIENLTEFGGDGDSREDIDDGHRPGKIVIEYSLYCKFWSLQDFFRNPNQCYDKVQWKVFCNHASSIVSTFEGLKLEHLGNSSNDSVQNYFSKYLTNRKLLDLQLYDVNFRRFVLLQFLILFQYLSSTVRFKITPSNELQPDQKNYIQNMSDRVHTLIKETPPDGVQFEAIVTKILIREEYWNAWKNDGCKEFRKAMPVPSTEEINTTKAPKQQLGDLVKAAREKKGYYMGNTELTKLWNINPLNLEACKAKERDFLPSMNDYFQSAFQNIDNGEFRRELFLRDGYNWRALRLLARRSIYFFIGNNCGPIRPPNTFLEDVVRRIATAKESVVGSEEPVPSLSEEVDLFRPAVEPTESEFQIPDIIIFRVTELTNKQFTNIAVAVSHNWKKLAPKLSFKNDEIEYIASNTPDPVQQAKDMLNLWFEEDEDATLENFLHILEQLHFTKAVDEVKIAIEENKNLTTDTSK